MKESLEKIEAPKEEPNKEQPKYTRADLKNAQEKSEDWGNELANYLFEHDFDDTSKESNALGRKVDEAEALVKKIKNALRVSRISSTEEISPQKKNTVEKYKTDYTLQDLKKAQKELKSWQKSWENYSGNNPNKYQADIKRAAWLVRMIEDELKKAGKIEMTPEEKLNFDLDKLYPNVESKTIVEHKGRKYQIRYSPVQRSRSGKTVKEWEHEWRLVEETSHKEKE